MARPDLQRWFRRSKVDQYLLAGERQIFAQRMHWAAFAEPLASAVAGLLVVLVVDYFMPAGLSAVTNILWWGWFFLVARAIWKWLLWRRNWLIATDKRLLRMYGLFTRKVPMMPLGAVTDMTYLRSLLGRLLGYGTFVMESAGQDQGLRRVEWVANPDRTYRALCAEIFAVSEVDPAIAEHDHLFEDGPPPHTPGLYAGYVHPDARTDPKAPDKVGDQSAGADEVDQPAQTPIRYTAARRNDQDPWYQSPDLRESAIRDADTGPIPYRRPATDEGDGWRPTSNDD